MTSLDAIAERVHRGAALGQEDAAAILGTHDLVALGALADEVRRRMHGEETTFVRVLELHVDAVPPALPSGAAPGEVRLIGRPASADAACAAVERARALAGPLPLTGFSLADLAEIERTEAQVFERLARAGLYAVGETPVDALSGGGALLARARGAGLAVQRLTVRGPIADPLAVVAAAVALQSEAGGFETFAPLSRTLSVALPTTGYDDVKMVSLARLLARDIPSVQVDWPLYGPKLAQVALTVGADDVDGIAAVEAGALGARRSVMEEINRNIRAAGLRPVERNGRYERLG